MSLFPPSLLLATVAVVALVLAAIVVADAALWALTVIPVSAGMTVAALMADPADRAWVVACVAAISLGTSVWSVRRFPMPSGRSPWLALAGTGCAAALCLVASTGGVFEGTAMGLGLAATTAAHALSIAGLRALFTRPWPASHNVIPGSGEHRRATIERYNHLPPTIRFWARAKLRSDPVFRYILRHMPPRGRLLDIGCGYGLPAVWLALAFPDLQIDGFDPLASRVRIARHVLDGRATLLVNDMERWRTQPHDVRYERVLCIDILHHLAAPDASLRSLHTCMTGGGVLLLRTSVRPTGDEVRSHRVERWMVRLRRQRTVGFYTEDEVIHLLVQAGFGDVEVEREGPDRVERLFVARKASY